ncbi:hypothetical protein COT20_01965 [bacterium (Candidatus Gribaldobacteria) CG08_land_8_20_14_0_20_39_15]|uniref:DUF192 domain-containing protein n=1 Tax=bacterium (Candidatus Gribaldobacteria) CG08_land_8_20_14_0_20_39_15 TaxID=2014273 RepID=A0A2M6XUD5_9BACT|nr:MAG: hypothetical protein COT20_01965 [bacterium (Candidatus Gribaldobacteria) CG08_land_8_20_14_0_20_39_15]
MRKEMLLKVGLALGLLTLAGLTVYFMIFHCPKTKVCFQGFCFQAEVAKNRFTIAKGLMFRKNLAQNQAMLFVFTQEGIRSFWMKNTLIPLDIIFLDKNKKVVDIIKQAQPCPSQKCESYRDQQPAQYVLEINGGLSEKIGLIIGGEFSFSDY